MRETREGRGVCKKGINDRMIDQESKLHKKGSEHTKGGRILVDGFGECKKGQA
jgi:hypothetical protein